MVKNLPAMQETQETQVWSLGRKVPWRRKMATCSSILAVKIPGTDEPGVLPRVGQDCAHTLLRKMKKPCCASALDVKSACSGSTSLWLSPEIVPETFLWVKTSPERIWNLNQCPGIRAWPPRSHTIQPCLYHGLSPCPKCPRETPAQATEHSRRSRKSGTRSGSCHQAGPGRSGALPSLLRKNSGEPKEAKLSVWAHSTELNKKWSKHTSFPSVLRLDVKLPVSS